MKKSCSTQPHKARDCDCNARQGLLVMLGFLVAGLVGMWVVAHLT